MNLKDARGWLAAAVIFFAAAGAVSADERADAARSLSAPPRAMSGSSGVRAAGWDGVSTEKPAKNDAGAWIIKNEAQLAWFSAGSEGGREIQDGDVVIQIDADLDLSGHDWTMISGGSTNITVNGGGHVIKGLTKKSAGETFGLFGMAEGHFTASDLHLAGVDITSTQVGALLAGIPSGYTATIQGCTVQGKISSSADGKTPAIVGGLVGSAGGVTIERCVADIEIAVNGTGYSDVGGGLVGSVDGGGCTIKNSAVYGSVYVKGRAAGGVVGLVSAASGFTSAPSAEFTSVTNKAAVTLVGAGSDTDSASCGAGGIVGVSNKTIITVTSSANYGTISASGAAASTAGDLAAGAGGIVGAIYGEDIMDIDNYTLSIGMSANLGSVTSTINGTDSGGSPKLGAGGLVGTSYYWVTDSSSKEFQLSISRSRNTGAVTGNDTNSAGGMIGYLSTVGTDLADATTAGITSSYNSGAVSALGGTAGGIVGSLRGEQMTGGDKNTSMTMSQVYSSVVPTGNGAYGFFGACDNNEAVVAATDAKHTNGVSMAWPNEGGYAADMNARATFLDTDTDDDFWRRFLDNGVLPPELERTRGNDYEAEFVFVLRGASATKLANGSVALRLVELPDGQVRATDATLPSYEVSVGGRTIAQGLRLDGGVLTIPADASLVDGAVITIRSTSTASSQSMPLSLNFATATGGEVRAVSVRGAPVIPSEDAKIPLWLEWVDASGVTHGDGQRPTGDPVITWSITEPTAPNWDVSVTPTASDPYRATLTISGRKSDSPSCQEFGVQVRVSCGTSEDIVYTRKFFAGAFPTQVLIAPAQQEMIDEANAVLARSNVAILPGNFQPAMSREFIKILEQRIADGLVRYAADSAAARSATRAADDPREIYVLDDMRQIEALMTPADPEPDTLPVCFVCTDKQAANVSLDISEGRLADVAPGAVGKIVLLPMTYSVTFESDDMRELFGDAAGEILADPGSDLSLGRIFDVLVLHKRIKEGDMNGWYTRLVSGVATPTDARGLGMMEVEADSTSGGLTVRLAYNVINYAGESFVISGPEADASLGYIILPDGLYNGTLIDPLWPNIWKRSQAIGTAGGGGGCTTGTAALAALAIAAIILRGKKR